MERIERSSLVPKTSALSIELHGLKYGIIIPLMPDINEQIEFVEKELRETPHHKATDHYIGMLRAKLARLKDRLIESSTRKSGGGGGYGVKKQGDATVILIGPPSAGKSTLLNFLTNAQSKVAPYAFTTLTAIPGMMEYRGARIQILDVPGLIEGAEEGKGRGREVLSVARGADLVILMTDYKRTHVFENIEKALERNGIRLNQTAPRVTIEKKAGGGVIVHSDFKQEVERGMIEEIAQEFGLKNGEITINERLSMERLLDAFSTNRVYVPAIWLVNKVDEIRGDQPKQPNYLYISAEKGEGIEELKEMIWEKLNFVRVYLSDENPMIVKAGTSLGEVAEKIGTDFADIHRTVKIWGPGAKFPGQEVSLATKVVEGMKVKFG